jgi:hypothetical protein
VFLTVAFLEIALYVFCCLHNLGQNRYSKNGKSSILLSMGKRKSMQIIKGKEVNLNDSEN